MKKVLQISAGTLPVAILCLLLFCTDFKNNNPATTSYQGNYSLELSWVPPSDSVKEVFKEYKIACVHGRDTFSLYTVDSPASSMAIDSTRRGAVDTLVIHFTRPTKDTSALAVAGVRPNNETVIDTIKAHVINPYFIRPNASAVIMGDTIIVSVSRPDSRPLAEGLFVVWSINGGYKPAQKALLPFSYIPPVQQAQAIGAHVQDAAGSGFYLDTVRISVGGYKQDLTGAALKTGAQLGEPLTLSFTQTDADSSKFRVYVVSTSGWRDSSAFLDFTGNATVQLGRPVIDTTPQSDTVYTIDVNGLKSNILVIPMTVTYSLPVVSFSSDSLIVSLNDTTPVTLAPQSTGKKFIWVLDSDTLKPDSASPVTCMVLLHDTLQHMLKVTGIDQFGYAGNAASIRVRAQSFAYVIQPIAFPTQPKVNTWTAWIAAVKDTALARQKNACFHWAIYPPNFDSIAINGKDSGTLSLRWSDIVVTTITLTVTDNINNGCAPYTKNVSVRRYAPYVKFLNTRPLLGKTTEAIKLIVSAADSNSDGAVQKILWQRTGKVPARDSTTDTTWQFMSVSPDTFDVYAWARDNDGFLSQPDTIHVMVKAYRPFILPLMRDTTVYINVPVRFIVSGNVSDPTATMAKYVWDFDGNGVWDDSTASDTIMHTFANPGKSTVIVKCRDNNKLESALDTFFVTISTGAPQRPAMRPDTVWINDDTLFTISSRAMNPGATLKQWIVQWVAAGPWETDTASVVRHAYAAAGPKQVTYYVKDNNGVSSDTVKDTVVVLLGRPSVASVAIDSAPSKIFVRDTLHFTVHGFDPNGQIDSMKVAWNGDTVFNKTMIVARGDSTVFANAFAASGTKQIRFRVYDDDGLSADTIISVSVQLGGPFISSIALDTPSTKIFMDQPVKFFVHGRDNNGHIDSVRVAWNGDSVFNQTMPAKADTAMFSHAFATSSTMQVRFRVYDNDGLSADTVISFFVHQGKPTVTSITPDSIIFINDARKFTIATFDTNGTVDSVKLDNGSGTFGVFVKTTAGGYLLNRTFARFEEGNQIIKVIAKDNDGLLSDTAKLVVAVRLGAPVIDRIAVDTSGNDLFVMDNRKYSVSAHDTNGFVKRIFFNWDGGTTPSPVPTDSIIIIRNTASIDTFIYHQYDTTMTGSRTVRTWARDDDTIVSISTKDTAIMVRLAAPVLWGDNPTKDTVWVVVNNGPGVNYNVHINSLDTNGKILQYYWSEETAFDSNSVNTHKTADSIYARSFSATEIHYPGFPMWIYGRDDDGLVRGRQFTIFADSAPPAPVTTVAKVSGQIQIGWLGKDVKDGNGTLFEILLKNGSAPAMTDTLIGFRSGTTLSPGLNGYDFSYTFTPSGGNGTYYYQVIAKDARGSISYNTANFFIFP